MNSDKSLAWRFVRPASDDTMTSAHKPRRKGVCDPSSRVALLCSLLVTACSGAAGTMTPPGPDGGSAPPGDGGQTVMAIDCSAAGGACPGITLQNDMPDLSGFHGYADPSMRKDPNSNTLFMAYSWPNVLADKTHVVDLHLSHSSDGGKSWSFDGPLFSAKPFQNPGTGNYAAANNSSHEVVDLIPINAGGSTMWVQAHMGYLVPKAGTVPYAQLTQTNYVSLSAVTVNPAGATSQLLALGTATEARLGNAGVDRTVVDTTMNPTQNLSSLNTRVKNCTNFNQPTLFYQAATLYLGVQCFEATASGDGASSSHFLFSTPATGSDVTKWQWSYVGELATPAQAMLLGQKEGKDYKFFTEMQLVSGKSGQLMAIISLGAPSGGQQPADQYGCRAIPLTSLSAPALQTDTSGVPVVLAAVTENDLYVNPNQGPGACTYDSGSSTGIVIVRKLENDQTLGFFVSLQATGLMP